MKTKTKVHVVTHTHWDREWYLTFEIFRMRLLTLMDNLKDGIKTHDSFKSFSLDGQTVVLEDYFELRPEKKEEIVSLIKSQKLEVGPWYILPDEFLITGESFIRNFLISHKLLKKWGIEGIKVGYLPDMFGHTAYTPSILKGLGLKAAILWRGVGDASRETEFIWSSPNGDSIPTINLIHSYSNGAHFGRDTLKMKEVFRNEIETLSAHKTTNNILIMNGTDHEFPLYELPSYFPDWEKEFGDVEILHSKFSTYVDSVLEENPNLKKVVGELKSPKYEFILKDVTSTRIYIKLANFLAQKLLTRYVEPLSSYLWWEGESLNSTQIEYAWKLLLKSHPHDSICGCSTDDVHKDVEVRIRSANEVSASLVANSLYKLAKYMDIDYEKGIPILVYNPYEYERDGEVSLFLPIDTSASYEVIDEKGEILESYIDVKSKLDPSFALESLTFLSKYKEAVSPALVDAFSFKRVTFLAKGLSPLGFSVFYLKKKEKISHREGISQDTAFENRFYRFILNSDGSFNLEDKINKITYENLNYFEDVGDGGDEYNFSWLPGDEPINSLKKDAKIIDVKDYGFEKVIKIHKEIELPVAISPDRKGRSSKRCILPIEITYKLLRDLPRVDVELTLTNTVKDHKLSFVVEVPKRVSEVVNDGYFGMVSHPPDYRIYDDNYTEEDISRYAMESFVVLNEEKVKLSVVTQGIHEYESHIVNENTKLTFTLLRAIEWLSRDDLTTRRGHAGPPVFTPDAQCLGTYGYRYAFVLLEEGSKEEMYAKAKDYLYEPVALGVLEKEKKVHSSTLPSFEFDKGLLLSALKVSDEGDSLILRLFSQRKKEGTLNIKTHEPIDIWDANMKEDTLVHISMGEENSIPILPSCIKTISLKRVKGGK